MLKIVLSTLISFILASCSFEAGDGAGSSNQAAADGRFIQALEPSRFLNETEIARLRRICKATAEARARSETYFDRDLQFVFSVQKRGCGESTLTSLGSAVAVFRRPVSGTPYLETIGNVSIIEDLLYEDHPYLSPLCSNIDTNTTISNQRSLGSDQLLYEFLINESMEVLQVTRFRTQPSGQVTANLVDTYKIYTEAITQNSEILGDVYERTQVLPCPTSTQTQTRFQRLNQVQRL